MRQLRVRKRICFQAITRQKQSYRSLRVEQQEVYIGHSLHPVGLPTLHTDISQSEHPMVLKTLISKDRLLRIIVYCQILHTNLETLYIYQNPQTPLDWQVPAAHTENPLYFMTHHLRNHPAHYTNHHLKNHPAHCLAYHLGNHSVHHMNHHHINNWAYHMTSHQLICVVHQAH